MDPASTSNNLGNMKWGTPKPVGNWQALMTPWYCQNPEECSDKKRRKNREDALLPAGRKSQPGSRYGNQEQWELSKYHILYHHLSSYGSKANIERCAVGTGLG